MDNVIRLPVGRLRQAAPTHSDVKAELTHHLFDLRVHAAVTLLGGLLAGYCGVFLCGSLGGGNILMLGGVAGFLTIAAFCLFEAHRNWRKATIAAARARAVSSPVPLAPIMPSHRASAA